MLYVIIKYVLAYKLKMMGTDRTSVIAPPSESGKKNNNTFGKKYTQDFIHSLMEE